MTRKIIHWTPTPGKKNWIRACNVYSLIVNHSIGKKNKNSKRIAKVNKKDVGLNLDITITDLFRNKCET